MTTDQKRFYRGCYRTHALELAYRTAWTAADGSEPDQYVHKPLSGIEIGVDQGETSEFLLRMFPRLTLYLVDPMAPATPGSSYWKTEDKRGRRTLKQWHDIRVRVRKRLAFAGERAKFLFLPAALAAKKIPPGSVDFVFVDGDHSFDAVAHDITTYLPKLKPDGVMCGHDYGNDANNCREVRPAVDAVARQTGRTVELGLGFTWFFKERGP